MRVTNYVVTASMGQIERFSTVSHFMIVEKLKTVLSFHIGENLGTVSYPTDIEKVMAVGIFNCCRCLTYHLVPASLFFGTKDWLVHSLSLSEDDALFAAKKRHWNGYRGSVEWLARSRTERTSSSSGMKRDSGFAGK